MASLHVLKRSMWRLAAAWLAMMACVAARGEVPVDVSAYAPECKVKIQQNGEQLTASWPIAEGEFGRLALSLKAGEPLIRQLGVSRDASGRFEPLVERVDPAVFLTVGSRQAPPGKPPEQVWQVFFDNPHRRPHHTYLSRLDLQRVKVASRHERATISVDTLTAGPFTGSLEFTLYAGCRLMRIDAVVSTKEDRLAMIYDAGLLCDEPSWRQFSWLDTEGRLRRAPAAPAASDQALAVRHRTLLVESSEGTLACFPPPHQFQFPRDYTDNLRFVWFGRGHNALTDRYGFGVRQNKDGGGNYVPWFNAPPKVRHRLGVFYLLTGGSADDALSETLRFTHGDRFPELPGYLTMTSHWHMAIAVAAMQRSGAARTNPPTPDFVTMFKDMNVNMVHLGEFHGDGHQKDPGPLRLPELAAMFDECRRWSDEKLLLIPGEEVNTFLGLELQGKHPGHWMSLFARPVYWTMQRRPDQPFVEQHPQYGQVYHVGDRGDMVRLIREENALVWAAHPRIKASSWTPDIFREEDFFLADSWLGGAWKAMPADLSHERLGENVLNLLDDMANWGQKKYVLGEVDVFKIDHTHELYGHMNINYVRLDRLPRFDDGWRPLLDAMRDGQFFVTTGEVLIPRFTVGGKTSGGNVSLVDGGSPDVQFELIWTFPLAFAEIISGDGERVYRERIDLSHTDAFGRQTFTLSPALGSRKWVRLEAWDVAANGAFTQPVWLTE